MRLDPVPTPPASESSLLGQPQWQRVSPSAPESYAPRRRGATPTSHVAARKPWVRVLRGFGEALLMLVVAAGIALVLRAFVVQVYKIPSESMMDTMDVGSRIAVNHVPVIGKQVERGDIIVFRDTQGWLAPADDNGGSFWSKVGGWFGFAPSGSEQIVVKRVIGVGGDTVACCDSQGRVTVNGVGVDETYLANAVAPSESEFSVTVPEGSYWVMGDNRSNSADSRYHNNVDGKGFIPDSAVIGRAQWEIWPLSKWSYLGNRDVFAAVPNAESS